MVCVLDWQKCSGFIWGKARTKGSRSVSFLLSAKVDKGERQVYTMRGLASLSVSRWRVKARGVKSSIKRKKEAKSALLTFKSSSRIHVKFLQVFQLFYRLFLITTNKSIFTFVARTQYSLIVFCVIISLLQLRFVHPFWQICWTLWHIVEQEFGSLFINLLGNLFKYLIGSCVQLRRYSGSCVEHSVWHDCLKICLGSLLNSVFGRLD